MQWWDKYQRTEFGVHGRLRETHFFLSIAYKLFLRYCVEKDFITYADEQHHHRSFEDLLTGLVRAQHERIKQGEANTPAKVDGFKLIRTLYKSGSLYLTKNKKHFHRVPEKYDGLIHDGLLCLRGERLLTLFQKAGCPNTLTDIRNALIIKEALYLDSEGKNKKIGNMRVYGIYLNRLY